MDHSKICERVLDIVAVKFDVERKKISLKTSFVGEPLYGEELDQLEFVEALEKEFAIRMPEESDCRIYTVGDCAKYVARLMKVSGMDEYVDKVVAGSPR